MNRKTEIETIIIIVFAFAITLGLIGDQIGTKFEQYKNNIIWAIIGSMIGLIIAEMYMKRKRKEEKETENGKHERRKNSTKNNN